MPASDDEHVDPPAVARSLDIGSVADAHLAAAAEHLAAAAKHQDAAREHSSGTLSAARKLARSAKGIGLRAYVLSEHAFNRSFE